MATTHETLLVERCDSHLWLTINRPDKANALTVDLMKRITAEVIAAGSDAAVHAVLLGGTGERAFCAGVDVREQPEDGDTKRHRSRRSHALAALQDAILDTPKPVIAVLNGTASGGGAMIALLADACVAVDTAKLSMPEIDLRIATYSGANILETVGGGALARDLVQSGRRMPMAEALSRGLVGIVVAREELQSAAAAAAKTLGSQDHDAFTANKRWMNRALKAALAEAREEHARHRAKVAT